MEKIFESFLDLFHSFYLGSQTLDFIKESGRSFIKSFEEIPTKEETIDIYLHNDEFYLNQNPFSLTENNLKKYLECLLLFEKRGIKGLVIKKTIKEENLIFWFQDFQKGEMKPDPWIRVIYRSEKNVATDLKYSFLKSLKDSCLLILRKKMIEKNIESGSIISYAPLREEIQRFYKDLHSLKERALCLIPFFLKDDEKFLAFLIVLSSFLFPLKISEEEMEDLLFSSIFYDLEDKKNWVPIIQSKNFSNGGFLSFLSSCNHPNITFTIFYCALKYIEFLLEEKNIIHPSEALKKLYNLDEISQELKDYIISILGKIPPSSPALTEECEPCLVISKNEIAVYQENKFILKEGKAEKPVNFEQFPFNPLYIILNLSD